MRSLFATLFSAILLITAVMPVQAQEDVAPLAGYAFGPDDAYLTIIMYGDFACAVCARYARDLEIVRATYPENVRLVWRHLPDTQNHPNAALAIQASEAAAAQGFFWEMHDQLFSHQVAWIALSPDEFRAALHEYAAFIGLDLDRFEAELDAALYAPIIEMARYDAAELGILGAPMLLYNGIPYTGRDDRYGLEEAARLALLEQRQFDAPPEMIIDPQKNYRATIVTEKGDIVITLFASEAPVAVNNFVFLARNGWYDNITFHYVVPDFIAQMGDPSESGRGSPGYTIPDEPNLSQRFDRAGVVAMAHPPNLLNSAGSQFFFTLAPLEPVENWNVQYTIFGAVLAGMDVLRSLTPRNANDPVNFPDPPPGDRVITVTIEEF
ncbi:MAG: peptidylprolyl isomerase [Anaerolineae bacterium]|nr:peptidylprolyl isomerase [Anaerolineae bacterium]